MQIGKTAEPGGEQRPLVGLAGNGVRVNVQDMPQKRDELVARAMPPAAHSYSVVERPETVVQAA